MLSLITRLLWFTGWFAKETSAFQVYEWLLPGSRHQPGFAPKGKGVARAFGRQKLTSCRGKNMAIYLCNGAVAPLVLLLLAGGAAGASDRYPADWNHVHQETLEHYTDILRMHTTNPPGNEPRSPVTSRTFSIANELPRNFCARRGAPTWSPASTATARESGLVEKCATSANIFAQSTFLTASDDLWDWM